MSINSTLDVSIQNKCEVRKGLSALMSLFKGSPARNVDLNRQLDTKNS